MRRTALISLLLVPVVAQAGFRVSSFKKETKLGANYWNVASALDSDPATAWMTDPDAEVAGQWIELDLPRGTVDALSLIPGWDADEEKFGDYTRVKKAKIEIFSSAEGTEKGVLSHEITVEDKRGWQTIDLPDTEVGDPLHGGRIRITILEGHEGRDFENLAISELLVRLKEKDAPTTLKEAPATSAAGQPDTHLVDANPKTFWAATGAGTQELAILAPEWGVSSLGIEAGPKTHARPKELEVRVGSQTRKYTLEDKPGMQWVELPTLVGYTGSAWGPVTLVFTETYPGSAQPALAVAELKLRATNYAQ
jgi:hypothetical protein